LLLEPTSYCDMLQWQQQAQAIAIASHAVQANSQVTHTFFRADRLSLDTEHPEQ